MMNPSVTLAIPTANRLHYLRETVADAREQDYENLEILVSENGGGSDGTEHFLKEIAAIDPRVHYRRNQNREPLIPHFNRCLDEASGHFFVLLSDDDRINAHFISSLVESFTENPRASVAVPANVIIDSGGRIIRRFPFPREPVMEGIDFVTRWLWMTEELPVANLVTVMARTTDMRKYRYQNFARGLNSDNLLFLQLALSGDVAFRQTAEFYWRTHQQQQNLVAPVREMDRAGRQFRRFVHKDPGFRGLLSSRRPATQRLILHGVNHLTAESYLHAIRFFENPISIRTVGSLFRARFNPALIKIVLRHLYQLVLRRWRPAVHEPPGERRTRPGQTRGTSAVPPD